MLDVEIGGFVERLFAYVIPGLSEDLFLGKPWLERNAVVFYVD